MIPNCAEDLVCLRDSNIVIFRRVPRDRWRVDRNELYRAIDSLVNLGYEIENPWRLESELDSYLLDLEYFYPGAIPSPWYALVETLNEERIPLAGETLEALGEPSYERYYHAREQPRSMLRDDRVSRREIETLVREDLELDPGDTGLRPLVGTTENAARAQWHYGMWGIYRRSNGEPIELLALYGHRKGGFGGAAWIVLSREDRDSWGPSLQDFARVGCATTGRTLFEWGRKSDTPDPLTADLFMGDRPEIRFAGGMDEVMFAADPTALPTLVVI